MLAARSEYPSTLTRTCQNTSFDLGNSRSGFDPRPRIPSRNAQGSANTKTRLHFRCASPRKAPGWRRCAGKPVAPCRRINVCATNTGTRAVALTDEAPETTGSIKQRLRRLPANVDLDKGTRRTVFGFGHRVPRSPDASPPEFREAYPVEMPHLRRVGRSAA